jgi:hypothetical protein
MPDVDFDPSALERNGWGQGSVLGSIEPVRPYAPEWVTIGDTDWLIVTSHDCDVLSRDLKKEPRVEVLRARVIGAREPDAQLVWGRNPRSLQCLGETPEGNVALSCVVHDRWVIPRALLLAERPDANRRLAPKVRRVIAEWLAKRYTRPGFPSEFDRRWRGERSRNFKAWTELLARHNASVRGVYLRLHLHKELDPGTPYRCHLILAAPAPLRRQIGWPEQRETIESEVTDFWSQFGSDIICDGVEVLCTDEITLADIDRYQRFDADWLSLAEDLETTPIPMDLRT